MHAVAEGSRPTGPLLRLCFAAAGVDGAFYLTLTGVPWKAMGLGAKPLVLGLLPAVWSIVYITGCGVTGRLSDRIPRIGMARVGTLVLAAAIGILALAKSLPGLFPGMALAAVGLSLFWPALQAAVAEQPGSVSLDRRLGWFNLSWSGGKSVGFLAGGAILKALGFGALFSVSISVILLVTLLITFGVPLRPAASSDNAPASPESDTDLVPESRRRRFLLLGWVANGASYGATATLTYHYPRLLASVGLGSDLFGAFLGLVYLVQTLTFLLLMRTKRWHYRRVPLYLVQVGLVVLLVLLPAVRQPGVALLLSPLAGIDLGLAYFSSIYYSLHVARSPGRNTGYHEAVIGAGSFLVPPIGGFLATRFGSLAIPFLFSASVLALAIAVQEGIARREEPRAA